MNRTTHGTTACLAAVVVVGSITAAGVPAVATDTNGNDAPSASRDAGPEASLAALEHELDDLRTSIDVARAEEIRALVQDVLADADTRPSLLDSGALAGWDKGFFIASADGAFRLSLKGQIQQRWLLSAQDDGPEDDYRSGFEETRIRLGFAGHVLDSSLTYFLWFGWGATGQTFPVDAWIKKSFGEGWSVTAGQFKVPIWREWLMSETRLQVMERSLLTARYGSISGQGLKLSQAGDAVRFDLAFTDGLRTWNTGWEVGPSETSGAFPYRLSSEFAFTGRVEARFGGTWAQHKSYEGWRDAETSLLVGAAAHFQRSESGTPEDEDDVYQWTVDANLQLGGANIAAAIIGTGVDDGADRDELGVLVQGGFFLTDQWELYARYEWGDLDGAGAVSEDLSIVTVGANLFLRQHGLKWTTDVGYSFNPLVAEWGGTRAGWRTDAPGQDGQVVLRTQMQLLF